MVGQILLAAVLLTQQAPEITVGIRPQVIRVGDRAVLTVRVLSAEGFPEFVDFPAPPGLVIEDFKDRSSAGVGGRGGGSWILERDLHLLAEAPGEYALPPVQVVVGGVMTEAPSPTLTVAAVPLRWPSRSQDMRAEAPRGRRNPDPVVPQGVPPSNGEMNEAQPQPPGGYSPWGYPGCAPFYPGQGPGMPWFPPGQVPGMPWVPPGAVPGWGGGQGFYPGCGYSPTPYGPNGGWPIVPPGTNPGVGMGWPWGGAVPTPYPGAGSVPGAGYYPGGGNPGTGGYPGTGAFPGGGYPPYGTPGAGGYPGAGNGYGGTPTLPAIPGGKWPAGMGGGWAETAASDPWWPEIVPELFGYSGWAQTPEGDASLAAGITPPQVFVGQQLTLVATAGFRPGAFLGAAASPEYLPPNHPDFWAVDLPDPTGALPTAAQGMVDQGYTFRRAFFPLKAGEYRLPPAALLLPLEAGRPGVVAWDTLATDPLPVSVLPVPQAPGLTGYAGAVGRYRLEAGVTPGRLAVGEAALLVVRILGAGNVRTLPSPQVGPVFGAEIAPAGDGAAVEVRDGVVGGVRTFTWLVVPTEPGPLRIDPILFSYFDPYLGDFAQVASEEIFLEVTEFPGGV